jgi:UDP-glucose 4-epimerase
VRVLVTGAAGFVGRVVVGHLLDHGHRVMALARRAAPALVPTRAELLFADLRDPDALGYVLCDQQVDAVVHLAAATTVRESWADPAGYYATNVGGTANLLAALGQYEVPVVFASTSAVYGSGRTGALAEDLAPAADNPYSASKLAAEQLLAYQARAGHVGAMILRLFNVAGAVGGIVDPNPTRIISACLRVAAGELDHVTVNGDGSAVREFTHVADVAEAVRLALGAGVAGQAQVLNVGTGEGVSMTQVIETARLVTGHPIPVVHRPPADEPQVLVSDPGRAAGVLGWKATHSLDQVVGDAWRAR